MGVFRGTLIMVLGDKVERRKGDGGGREGKHEKRGDACK
jgi:hypothetical protein